MIILGVISFLFWALVAFIVLAGVFSLFGMGIGAISEDIQRMKEFRKKKS